MIEVWKDIEDFRGKYQVSILGKVRSLNYLRTGKKRLLKFGKTRDGYLYVGLWDGKRQRLFYVHRLVCQAFLPNPHNLPEVNHLNEIKTDNRLENLEWISRKDNVNYGTNLYRVGRFLAKEKKTFQFSMDGMLINVFTSVREAERSLGITSHPSGIYHCCQGRVKTAYGYKWSFAEGVTIKRTV